MSCVMTTAPIPVVVIHGLWLHATSWQPWLALFREAGYDPAIAAGWPREPDTVEQARTQPDLVANIGIDDATHQFADIIGRLGTAAVIIGDVAVLPR